MALTTRADVAAYQFLDRLAPIVLMDPDADKVWPQFVSTKFQPGLNNGDTIKVNRVQYVTDPANEAARRLTEGTRISIASGNVDKLTFSQASLQVLENGMLRPLGLSYKVVQLAQQNDVELAGLVIKRDHDAWLDVTIRDLYVSKAAGTLYGDNKANRDAVTNTTADGMNSKMLNRMRLELQKRNIARFGSMHNPGTGAREGGFYICVIDEHAQAQLLTDTLFVEVVRNQNADRIFNGEIGDYLGMKVVVSNNMPDVTTMGNPDFTGSQSVAFGMDQNEAGEFPVAHGISDPVHPAISKDDDFQREFLYIWKSLEGFASLDTGGASSTNRFIQLAEYSRAL